MMLNQPFSRSSPSSSFSSSASCDSASISDLIPLRVFLVQTAKGLFSSSGGYRANICLLRHLASRGHQVRQLCYSHPGEAEAYVQSTVNSAGYKPYLRKRQLHLRAEHGGPGNDVEVSEFPMDDGVQIVALDSKTFHAALGGEKNMHKDLARQVADYIETGRLSAPLLDFVSFIQQEVAHFSPTHIISNDGLSMKATSPLEMPNMSVCRIGVIHTAEQLPFGPFAGGMPGHSSSPNELELLQTLDGLWSVSNAIKKYALKYGRLKTTFLVHHPWTYLEERKHRLPVHLHNWDKQFIGLINPCAVKGLSILISLAKSCPQYNFLVYRSWGYDDQVAKQLESLDNITIRPTCTDMEAAWRDIKVLLVPSLWHEAWGMVIVEAHLRGIPVISSNAGAIPEAMLGMDYIVPVNPIEGERDEDGAYIVPEQDVGPWVQAVNELMTSRPEYFKLSSKVRYTTEEWLKNLDETALEHWLLGSMANVDNYRMI